MELVAQWRRRILRAPNVSEATKQTLAQLSDSELAMYLEKKGPRGNKLFAIAIVA